MQRGRMICATAVDGDQIMDEPRHGRPAPWQQEPQPPHPQQQPAPPPAPWAGQAPGPAPTQQWTGQPQQQWAPQPQQQPRPSAREARIRTNKRILGWAGYPAALIVGILIGAGGNGGGADTKTDTTTTAAGSAVDSPDTPATQDAPAVPAVGPDNYRIEIKTLSKQCFGSAGCNVEIRLSVGGDPVTDGVAVELSVKVTGDESGPLVETISLDESGSYGAPELSLATPSSGTKVRAKVTDVEIQ